MRKYPHTITIWLQSGTYDGSGQRAFAVPTTVSGKWQDSTSLVKNNNAKEIESKIQVLLESQDLSEGDWIFLGTSVETNPRTVANAFEVKAWNKTATVAGERYTRVAFL